MADRFEIGGDADDPAITVGGRTVTYGQMRDRIHRTETRGPVDLSGLGVVEALTALFAAARTEHPVMVGGPPPATPIPDGTFLLVRTSGSAGTPKSVARTASSWTASFGPLAEITGLTAADTVLLTGPLDSTLHLFAAVHTLWLGAHLTDDPATATAVHAVPPVLADLLASSSGSLRTAVVAGDHLPAALEDRAVARGLRLVEYYGAAELSFVAARVAPAPLTPFPGVAIRIADDEIWVRSGYVALDRIGSAPLRRSPDGFVTVGDLGALTSNGELVVRGRGDSAVTTGGHTVLTQDVEDVLRELPGVLEAAVFASPHRRLGQVPGAAVVLDRGTELREVRAAARSRLSGPARPRRWVTLDVLPRTPNGKIARAAIAASVR